MRTLVVSDIHSNIEALNAVFADAEEHEPVERVLSLGDIVGYGPAPMACLEVLWERHAVSIQGNHDAAVAGTLGVDDFNAYAAEAARWTTGQLSSDAIQYLADLPQKLVDDSFLLVHGSPRAPLWDYLMTYGQAVDAWEHADSSDVLVGHSHFQFAVEAGRGIEHAGPNGLTVPLGHARLVVNPGSVGQPRDSDSRAAYAIYDDDARMITLHRVWYDISATQRSMADVGLPDALISRLSVGR
jgi:diadenosine tetraphosphatase ApaH/serine/threonine PP2A family protein phosphatase